LFDQQNMRRQVAASRTAGNERVTMDNAVSVLSGLTGINANDSRKKVNDANDKEVEAVNNKRALDLSTVYRQISADADAEARNQLTDATANGPVGLRIRCVSAQHCAPQ
jgi:hypothetical protein